MSVPNSFVSLFVFYILSYLLLKRMGCLSECLVSSASIQKLFCGSCSAFKWSFDEFVMEKVVSSPILSPPCFKHKFILTFSIYVLLIYFFFFLWESLCLFTQSCQLFEIPGTKLQLTELPSLSPSPRACSNWVYDVIQPSHPLSSPFPPAFILSQHQGLF